MPIRFTTNDRPTIGVELELHIVDAETGDLVSASNELLAALGVRHPGGEHPKAKHELFQSTVEVITGVCDTPDDARADLVGTLVEVRAELASRGLRLLSAGTHPFATARRQDVSPNPRYHDLVESMQWPARRLLICGQHVHVGVRDGTRAVEIINEMTRHLPLLLALSSSSPYFEGEDTGLASARSKIFESLPTAGLPPQLHSWADVEEFMTTLVQSGCISSIREVWWDIRPHPDFGTVEFRMFDAPHTLDEVVALAALTQTLVAWADRMLDDGRLGAPPREWTVRENRWLAARYGIDAELIVEHPDGRAPSRRSVRDLVAELLERVGDVADEIGTSHHLDAVLDIVEHGPGSTRQRRLVDAGADLPGLVGHLADEFDAGIVGSA